MEIEIFLLRFNEINPFLITIREKLISNIQCRSFILRVATFVIKLVPKTHVKVGN